MAEIMIMAKNASDGEESVSSTVFLVVAPPESHLHLRCYRSLGLLNVVLFVVSSSRSFVLFFHRLQRKKKLDFWA